MIAAIVLTYRGPKPSKNTNPNKQVFVKAKDRMRIVQMPVEKD
jgi:NADH-quinone oxidoreductase subunit J